MMPDIAKKGHSFNGAMAYYLHDKGKNTAERVGWTETRNLMTDDPHAAKRIMIATALQSDELKKAAGIKASGRKSAGAVYAYALSWHPDKEDAPNKAEMLSAVDASLKELKAEHLQSVIVCHTDQKHPHVHVILNRVDPADGRMHTFSNDRLKLQDWAEKYDQERGNSFAPAREEKRQKREQYQDKKQRQEFALAKREEAKARPKDSLSPAAMLKDLSAAQKESHRQEWSELSATNKAKRNAIYDDYRKRIKDAATLHKQECKPFWRDHFEHERQRKKEWDKREANIIGVVKNAMEATSQQYVLGELDGRKKLSAVFSNVISSQKRRAIFDKRLDMDKQTLRTELKSVLDGEIQSIQGQRKEALKDQRASFDQSRTELIQRQDAEWQKVREAWKQLRTRPYSRSGGSGREDLHTRRSNTRLEIQSNKNEARNKYLDRRAGNAELKTRTRHQQKETDPVKKDWETKAPKDIPKSKKQPTRTATVSAPSPAPSPAGEVPRTTAKRQTVPAKDWSKTSTTMAHVEGTKPKPMKKDWEKTGASKAPIKIPKDWSKKVEREGVKSTYDKSASKPIDTPKDWAKKAEPAREIRKAPHIKRDLDRSR